ncbi:MAG: hypothetical protein JEZ06_10390 [Anaerolineaceae bacterium]|nr:hypothetical protein [Anaerolineaceae bacterium]
MNKKEKIFIWLTFIEGMFALGFLLNSPSEYAFFLGFSKSRWLLIFANLIILSFLIVIAIQIQNRQVSLDNIASKFDHWVNQKSNLFWCSGLFFFLALFLAGAFFFTYLFINSHFRGFVLWGTLFFAQLVVYLRLRYPEKVSSPGYWKPLQDLPAWKNLDSKQKKVFWVIFTIGFIYFLTLMIPNLLDAKDEHMLHMLGGDENNTYPYIIWMLTPGTEIRQIMYRLFIFEGYHYGYPFFVLSAFVLLPMRLLFGIEFSSHTQINLLLLRQFISVLPIILSAGILVYLQTRFKHLWKSIILFLLILFIPAVMMNNIRYWHPDALVVLSVVATIFFLVKDGLNFNINFFMAAFFCGMASSIKLYGYFFFLVILGILLYAYFKKRIDFKKMLIVGMFFIVIMILTFLLTNPFLFHEPARMRYMEIMADKSIEMRHGYADANGEGIYVTGLNATLPFWESFYGNKYFILFLFISMIGSTFIGKKGLLHFVLLGWVVTVSMYILGFVVLKHYQFWLPVFIPLYSTALSIFDWDYSELTLRKTNQNKLKVMIQLFQFLVILILVLQFSQNIYLSIPQFSEWLRIAEIVS